MKGAGTFRLPQLLSAIARMMLHPLIDPDEHKKKLKELRREVHHIYGSQPIYIPRHGKLKGWQKELKRKKH